MSRLKTEHGNVIQLPSGEARIRALSAKKIRAGKPRSIGKALDSEPALRATPGQMGVHESMQEIRKILGHEINPNTYLDLAVPPIVKVSSFEGGVELYDSLSTRQAPRAKDESFADLGDWVKFYYFSAFEKDGKVLGRFIDRCNQNHRRLNMLEMVLRDPSEPGKYTLEGFIEAIKNGSL